MERVYLNPGIRNGIWNEFGNYWNTVNNEIS